MRISLLGVLCALSLVLPFSALAGKGCDSITLVVCYRDDFSRESLKPKLTVMDADSTVLCELDQARYNDYSKAWFFVTQQPIRSRYILRAELAGYMTELDEVLLKRGDRNAGVKEATGLLMSRTATSLGEVMVNASRILMVNRGDTIVYNATAFNLTSGSMLDALVRSLPGAELNNGRITVNGEFVSRLLVDGRDFFRGNPRVALENFPAYYVDKIKVYHEVSLKRRMAEGDSAKADISRDPMVMDVTLKRDYAEGWIANAEGAGGTRDTYLLRFFSMRYTKHSNLFLYGNANNLCNTESPDKEGTWGGRGNSPEGILATRSVGANLNIDGRRSKGTFDTSLKFDMQDVDEERVVSTDNFFCSGDTYLRNRSQDNSRKSDVTWNALYRYDGLRMGKRGGFAMEPSASYTHFHNNGTVQSAAFLTNPEDSYRGASLDSIFAPLGSARLTELLINRREVLSRGKHETWNLGGTAFGYIPVSGYRTLSLNFCGKWLDKKSWQYEKDDLRFNGESTHDRVCQHRYVLAPNREYNYSLAIGMPYFSVWKVRANVEYSFQKDYASGERSIYRLDGYQDYADGQMPLDRLPSTADSLQRVVDVRNSYFTRTENNQNKVSFLFAVPWKNEQNRLELNIPVSRVYRRIIDDRNMHRNRYSRTNGCVAPSISYMRYASAERNFSISASYSKNLVPMRFLLEVRDDSDPLNIFLGNSRLRDERACNLSFKGAVNNSSKSRYQNVSAQYWHYHNSVSMGKYYDRGTGISTFKPQNINGNWYATAGHHITQALDSLRHLFFTNDLALTYRNSSDYVSEIADVSPTRSEVRSFYFSESVKFDYHFAKATLSAKARANWTHAESPRDEFSMVNVVDYCYGLSLVIPLLWGVQLDTDFNVWSHRGYSDSSMNKDELQWNANLIYACFSEKQLVFKLTAYDILNQISNVRQVLNAQGRKEVWHNTLPRHFMLHVSYRFHKKPVDRRKEAMI